MSCCVDCNGGATHQPAASTPREHRIANNNTHTLPHVFQPYTFFPGAQTYDCFAATFLTPNTGDRSQQYLGFHVCVIPVVVFNSSLSYAILASKRAKR